ncbi:type V CRISPR-associated protein Cpf1, partial [Candidatus Roizmanbacteria bacterium CG10_big_fil_rev_8_21_14_0_10_39_6]
MKQSSAFSKFTNQYSLSKTLRFELKPIRNTQKMLDDAGIFAKDELIQKKYEKTKPYFAKLHREFINEALNGVALIGLEEHFQLLKEWQKDRKNNVAKTAYETSVQRLRKEIVKLFDSKAKDWVNGQYIELKLKNKTIEILFEEAVFGLLKARYGEEKESFIEIEKLDKEGKSETKEISIFDSWKGFVGYFDKFFQTRKNFYKSESENGKGKSGQISTRIIDQNLKRFCDNLMFFESVKEKVSFDEIEKTFDITLSQIFSLNFYNNCFLQDGIDYYNKIIGGETLQNGEKIKGLNELINQYRQNNKDQKISFFKLLDKQILSEKTVFIDEIKNDTELLDALHKFAKIAEEKTTIAKNLFFDFVTNNDQYALSQIYISREAFNTISNKWTNETETFARYLYEAMKSEKLAKYDKQDNSYKFPDFIALSYVNIALKSENFDGHFWKEKYYEVVGFDKKNKWDQFLLIFLYEFQSLFDRTVKDEDGNKKQVEYNIFSQNFRELIEKEPFVLSQETKVTIKEFADSVLTIYQMAKYFAVEKKRAWLAEYELDSFYTKPDTGYLQFYDDAYENIVQVYNKLRNYLTKKPYSEQKWKLNFGNPTLADGWDKNKESDNSAVLLRKNRKYFLGLMTKGHNKIFDNRFEENFLEGIKNGKYEKVVYKFFPDQAKMFPKVCFSAKGLEFFEPSEDVIRIYKNAEFKKGETFSVGSMHRLIDFYKDCLAKYEGWKLYSFKHLKPTNEYQDNIGEFFRDVAEDGYKVDFQDISGKYIQERNEKGELYLFEIHNKDWNLDKAKDGKLKTTA